MTLKIKCLIFLFLGVELTAFAQNGIIRGQIIDDATGEPLIGATVLITGTTTGAATDLDGKFTLNNVSAGTHSIQSSYVSYQPQTIENVKVEPGQVTVLNIRLKPESIGLQEVVVTAQALRNTESALLTTQRRASLVLDGISSEQISRTGDSDAAAAIRRVTGVSVEGGKYVYVRGLGDRYSKTALNNAEIPGLDPDRNSVQMDLFPSNLIDNLVIYKTFSPELPASFTGGFVNVTTKDFPDRFTMQVSASAGYNTNATFNNRFLTQENLSPTFALGFDNGARAIPDVVRTGLPTFDQAFSNPNSARQLDAATKAFDGSYNPRRSTPLPNHNFAFSIGNQKEVFGRPLGFVGGVTYQRNYEFYEDGRTGRFFLTGPDQPGLDVILDASDARGTESVLWGALLNTTYKLNARNKIGINLMRNQSADASSRYQQGVYPYRSGINDASAQRQIRSLQYLERSITSGQLRGEHAFGGDNPVKIDWISAYTLSTQDEPDLRFFNNTFSNAFVDTTFVAVGGSNVPPARYFRDMEEDNFDNKINAEIPVKLWRDLVSKVKLGGAYIVKNRRFNENIFEFTPQSATRDMDFYNGDVDAYLGESNLGLVEDAGSNSFGIIVRNQALAGGSYRGDENIPAAYAMIDLQATKNLKISAGARYEGTDITLTNLSPLVDASERVATLKNTDILPAVNITQQLRENMNLRFAYGRTLARPTFRELANYTTFDFLGDAQLTGSSDLVRTLIDNVDLRWEFYPKSGEILSVSAFYKLFQNPIEKTISTFTNEPDRLRLNFRNVDEARVVGMEFEFRKDLSFISENLQNFRVGGNLTLLDSRVNINEGELSLIRVYLPDAPDTRSLVGQAPYLINATLSYTNPASDISANLVYNVSGERLSVVSVGGTPNIYEQPRNLLDFNIRKGFGDKFSVRFAATNLLNAQYRFTQVYRDEDYVFQSYQIGRTFSLGVTYALTK